MALQRDASAAYRPTESKGGVAPAVDLSKTDGHTRAYSSTETKYKVHWIIVAQRAIFVEKSFGNKGLGNWASTLIARHAHMLWTLRGVKKLKQTHQAFATTVAPV